MPPAPPCGNVGQVPFFCHNEAFLAYSKSDHVSTCLSWATICIAPCYCFFRLDSLLLLGRERREFG